MRIWALAVAAILLVAAAPALGLAGDGHDSHVHLGTVAQGDVGSLGGATALYWEAPWVACTTPPPRNQPSAPPSCTPAATTGWELRLTEAADLLRVDLDHPYRQDTMTMRVHAPDGRQVVVQTGGDFGGSARFENASPGTYQVVLQVHSTVGSIARLRAGVVPATPAGSLLPNLRVLPPFEFGFTAPINPANSVFLAADSTNPGMAVGQRPVYSCTPDEVQEAADPTRTLPPRAVARCLRFTAGPQNAGAGHFDLRFPILQRALSDRDRVLEMTQVVHHTDGSSSERPAGTYEYHATHGHYHYAEILFYELLAVEGEELRRAGLGNKSGFCPVDQGIADWESFVGDQLAAVYQRQEGDCYAIGGRGAMGLTAGWSDVYRWQRPGQYVDFTLQPDGEYVVRVTVDINDRVLETDEDDNVSYAWIRVTGDTVEVLERGHGTSHLDHGKMVVEDGRGQYPVSPLVKQ